MSKIKVIVVDDSKFIRTLFTGLLNEMADIEVVDSAEDPFDAREKIKLHNPDVITLDVEMPKMDGLSFLEKIMKLRPMPVVMASTLTQAGADTTIRALEMGAVDYVSKPTNFDEFGNLDRLKNELASKIRVAAKAKIPANIHFTNSNKPSTAQYKFSTGNKIIAIGASTGGVESLRVVLSKMPENCPPIVVTQHMPEKFTASFAARLSTICSIKVVEASDGELLKNGTAYIAPGGKHMKIMGSSNSGYKVKIEDGPLVSGHKPSVDFMFSSLADVIDGNCVAAILTGMGRDGAEGMLKLKQKGCPTIGQNQETCVVYGMPRAAKEIGAIDKEVALEMVADEILKLLAK